MKKQILLCSALLALVFSCGKNDEAEPQSEEPATYIPEGNSTTPDANFSTNSQSVSYDNAVWISFDANGNAVVDNQYGATAAVTKSGGHVTVNSTAASQVTYVLSGVTSDGSFKIYSTEKKFTLVLNGVSIQNPSGPAINIQDGKSEIVLVDNTANRLIDGSSYAAATNAGEDQKGTFFSEKQTDFLSGDGSLLVYGNNKHAICVDNALTIHSGTIKVNNAATDGIHCNKVFTMNGGVLEVQAYSDCIESEKEDEGGVVIAGGSLKLESMGEEGGKCVKSAIDMTVSGGTLNLFAYASAGKCLKSTGNMAITGGTINLKATGNSVYDSTLKDFTSPEGIKCDGNFSMSGNPVLSITCTGRAGKGLSADGTILIDGGTTTIATSGAQHVISNSYKSSAKAIKAKDDLTVNSGTIKITTSTAGAEGLESKADVTINGGTVEITAYDDCINAAAQRLSKVTINGGRIYCYSTNGDGIDSNGSLYLNGGTVIASGTGSPEDGLDADNNTMAFTGGTVVGIGGATSSPSASYCTQRVVVWNTSAVSNGNAVCIKDPDGNAVMIFKTPRAYAQNMALVFSSGGMTANGTYTIHSGGSVSGGSEFHGLYTGATYSGGSQAGTFSYSGTTMTATSGTANNNPGGGGPGGKPF